MNIMTRCGSADNVLIYEHYCDTKEDMQNIDPKYINLGSICIVVKGTNDELEIYMADSEKKWQSLGIGNSSGGGGSSSGGFLKVGSTLDPATFTITLDKTWQEIYDALAAGWYVSVVTAAEHARINCASVGEDTTGTYYFVSIAEDDVPAGFPAPMKLEARARNEYPTWTMGS